MDTSTDIRLVELKEDWKESKYFSGNGTTEHRSFVARNLKKYAESWNILNALILATSTKR